MKAVWYTTTGPAREVLVVGEQPDSQAAAGEVRVRLAASAVNPADCNRRAGRGYPMEFPLVVPNSDGAGIIDAVGTGVDPALIGERVWIHNGQRGRALGTAAEWIALDRALVAPLAPSLSYAQGACLGIPCMTAWVCLDAGGVRAGAWVLVTGGAGAVGHYAVQLAQAAGARVIATVSSDDKATHARAGGAEYTIDYRREPVAARVLEITGDHGADLVVEVDFGGNLESSLAALAQNGVIATYASKGAAAPAVPWHTLARKNASIRAMMLYSVPAVTRARAQAHISLWASSENAIHAIAAEYPLAETAAAHEAVERGDKRGTVIVRCDA